MYRYNLQGYLAGMWVDHVQEDSQSQPVCLVHQLPEYKQQLRTNIENSLKEQSKIVWKNKGKFLKV